MQTHTLKQSLQNIFVNTFKNSKKTILFMLKIIVPITFIVNLLKYLDLIKYITFIFEPIMQYVGLPGDAALVLITANVINIYGGLAVMTSLSFTVKEVTILAVMILFSHSLIIESAIIKSLTVSIKKQLLFRISAALFSGIILNLFIGNHYQEIAYPIMKPMNEIPKFAFESGLFILWAKDLLFNYLTSILKTTFSLVWIITSILFGLEVLKEFKILEQLNNLFYHLTKHLGMSKSATSSLIVGFFIGITYGAGAILVHYKEGKMTKNDVTLVSTFLLLAHAIIEDVLLFVNLGAIPWILIPYKVLFAIFITYTYNLFLMKDPRHMIEQVPLTQ